MHALDGDVQLNLNSAKSGIAIPILCVSMVTACPRGVVRGDKAGHKLCGEVNFLQKNSTVEAHDTSEENLNTAS